MKPKKARLRSRHWSKEWGRPTNCFRSTTRPSPEILGMYRPGWIRRPHKMRSKHMRLLATIPPHRRAESEPILRSNRSRSIAQRVEGQPNSDSLRRPYRSQRSRKTLHPARHRPWLERAAVVVSPRLSHPRFQQKTLRLRSRLHYLLLRRRWGTRTRHPAVKIPPFPPWAEPAIPTPSHSIDPLRNWFRWRRRDTARRPHRRSLTRTTLHQESPRN
jgi:hypothetical protein